MPVADAAWVALVRFSTPASSMCMQALAPFAAEVEIEVEVEVDFRTAREIRTEPQRAGSVTIQLDPWQFTRRSRE